ncbi:MAG TPA: response regulator [Nitrososphaeraceae archaeon]
MASPPSSNYSNNNNKRILLVDDERDVCFTFKEGLEDSRFITDTYINPVSALNNFKPHIYDLVILDIKMPAMNGFELYKEIKKIDPNTKICFLTAGEEYYEELREEEEEYCDLDKSLFIQKPISNEEIIREINKRINSS